MSSDSFKNDVNNKLFTEKITHTHTHTHTWTRAYIHTEDLAVNNPQGMICDKINQTKPIFLVYLYQTIYIYIYTNLYLFRYIY